MTKKAASTPTTPTTPAPSLVPTEILVVLDRSGSMATIKEDVIGGYNTFIEEQQKVGGECRVTLTQFDNEHETVYAGLAVEEVPALTEDTFVPRGSTALLDAIARGVGLLIGRVGVLAPDAAPQVAPVLVIFTDGMENASREVNLEQVKQMIEDCKAKGWGVTYLGANQDGIKEGMNMGFSAAQSATFTNETSSLAMGSVARSVASYRQAGGGMSGQSVMGYSLEERSAMNPGATSDAGPEWLGTTGAAQSIGVSPSTLRRLTDKGEGPTYTRSTATSPRRFRRADLDSWLRKVSS